MESAKDFISYLRAGYSCFWVQSQEPRRAMTLLEKNVKEFVRKDKSTYTLGAWDCEKDANPIKPLEAFCGQPPCSVLFLSNFHWFLKNPVIQKIQNHAEEWKNQAKAIVVFSPESKIPKEIEKDFLPLEFSLPDAEEIGEKLDFICEGQKVKKPEGDERESIISAATALTMLEAENIFYKSLVDYKKVLPSVVAAHKKHMVEHEGLIQVVDSNLTFDDIRGYENAKYFANATVFDSRSKGLLFVGVPGCGKTLFLHCLAGELMRRSGIPTLALDFGRVFSKFQGESDERLRRVEQIIRRYKDVLVICDEFEKQFAGAGGSGELDSGTTRRVTGAWLRFMQERPEGVRILGTCNSVMGMPPEYLRPGRWDTSPFFIDLPTEEERSDILFYHAKKNSIKVVPNDVPEMENWTGAEIEALCRNASLTGLTLKKAANFIIPQVKTMREDIEALREWAKDRTLPATEVKMNGLKEKKVRALDIG